MVRTSEFKVGIIVVAGFLAVATAAAFLVTSRMWPRGYSLNIRFGHAYGLQCGAPVMVRGVRIGEVTRVELTKESNVRVSVRLRPDVRIWNTSRIRIQKSGLLGESFVNIIPVRNERSKLVARNATLRGEFVPQLEDLFPEIAETLKQFATTVTRLKSVDVDSKSDSDISITLRFGRRRASDRPRSSLRKASAVHIQQLQAQG